jgi:hypothetical protein
MSGNANGLLGPIYFYLPIDITQFHIWLLLYHFMKAITAQLNMWFLTLQPTEPPSNYGHLFVNLKYGQTPAYIW